MTQVSSGERREDETMQRIAAVLQNGLLVVDTAGDVVWMDEATRHRLNGGSLDGGSLDGGSGALKLPLSRQAGHPTVECFVTTLQVDLKNGPEQLCVLQMIRPEGMSEPGVRTVMDAVEEIMAEPSWFTQSLLEKLKARLRAGPPVRRASDLDRLSLREREILALVCEGRTDAEMGRVLNLSQNTVRNHLASLFRKIGVNRRSAAVIWARERAITKHDILASPTSRNRRRLS